MNGEFTYLQLLERCLDQCREHYRLGKTDTLSFSFNEKGDAVRIANYIRREFDCYLQEAGERWYVILS